MRGGIITCTQEQPFSIAAAVYGFQRLAWQKLCQGLKYIWGGAGQYTISGPSIMTVNQSILLSAE